MRFSLIKRAMLSGTAVAVMMLASPAVAGGFAPREQSAEAQGASFAGAAAGSGGLSSMFWNPATLTDMPGWQSSYNAAGIFPFTSNTPSPSTPTFALGPVGNNGSNVLLPSSYTSYQINDQLWLGLASNTPFGSGTQNPRPSAAQLYGLTTTVFSADINPNIAYKVNEFLSLGVGVEVMYFKVRQTVGLAANFAPPTLIIKGDSWGVGFTAGATIKPWAGTEIGIGYRSQITEKTKGTAEFGAGPLTGISGQTANFNLPETVSVGLRQRVTSDITLLAGYEWTNWSRIKTINSIATGGVAPAGLLLVSQGLNYKNGWMASLGGEYQWTPQWKLRAGVAYEKAPIDNTNRGVTLLDTDRIWTSIGASYQMTSKLSFDVAYSHLFGKNGTINIPAVLPRPSYTGSTRAHVDILSVALNYRWDDPKVAAPVFAKY